MVDSIKKRFILIVLLTALALCCSPAIAESAGTLTVTGDDLVDEGKYEEAISYYDQAIALEPRMAMAWTGKGVALN